MTNAQIIFNNRVFLMEQGVIKGTDERIVIQDEQGEREIAVPEEIHTFQTWKALGYQVQKGEHAVAKSPVWKFKAAGKKQEQEAEDEEQPETGRYFMKVAFFFTADQVKPIEKKEVQ